MRKLLNGLSAAAGIAILSACTSGQSGIEPPHTGANIAATTALQFRVGTALYSNGQTYLNTVVTFRQANGLSATLYNTPTITAPNGFVVPSVASAGTDAGTNHISGTPPTQPGTAAVPTTFNQSGGAFAYGFAPANSTTSGAANYPKGNFSNVYTQPIYLSSSVKRGFELGPPAVPDFHNGTFPAGFLGYDSGFMMFGAAPVAGTYGLQVVVPSGTIGQNSAVLNASGTLTSIVPLPVEAPPVITSTNDGGATFTVAPAPAGVTHQVLYITNGTGPTVYSFDAGAAGGVFTLGPTSGPKDAGGNPSAPFSTGDSINAVVVGADYDIVGNAPPINTQETPALPAQTDITVSTAAKLTY